MADEPIDLARRRDLEAQRRTGDAGFGALLFTVYHYEEGHVVHVPAEQMPGDPHAIWKRMFSTLWHDAGHVFRATDDPADEILLLTAIAASGRVVTYTDNQRLDTLERIFWIQHMLKRIGQEDMPSFKCIYHNDNQETSDGS